MQHWIQRVAEHCRVTSKDVLLTSVQRRDDLWGWRPPDKQLHCSYCSVLFVCFVLFLKGGRVYLGSQFRKGQSSPWWGGHASKCVRCLVTLHLQTGSRGGGQKWCWNIEPQGTTTSRILIFSKILPTKDSTTFQNNPISTWEPCVQSQALEPVRDNSHLNHNTIQIFLSCYRIVPRLFVFSYSIDTLKKTRVCCGIILLYTVKICHCFTLPA